jgi:hypothetical protein
MYVKLVGIKFSYSAQSVLPFIGSRRILLSIYYAWLKVAVKVYVEYSDCKSVDN